MYTACVRVRARKKPAGCRWHCTTTGDRDNTNRKSERSKRSIRLKMWHSYSNKQLQPRSPPVLICSSYETQSVRAHSFAPARHHASDTDGAQGTFGRQSATSCVTKLMTMSPCSSRIQRYDSIPVHCMLTCPDEYCGIKQKEVSTESN